MQNNLCSLKSEKLLQVYRSTEIELHAKSVFELLKTIVLILCFSIKPISKNCPGNWFSLIHAPCHGTQTQLILCFGSKSSH